MKDTKWANEYRLTTVCVDSYDNCELSGRFYNPHLSEGNVFRSIVQFLKEMEKLLDDMNFPQSFAALRSFGSSHEQKQTDQSERQARQGKLATFAVRVIFRQNASWQGSVTWLEEGKEQSFRSALELILLMDSALSEVPAQDKTSL